MSETSGLGIDVGSLGCRFAVVEADRAVPLWLPGQLDQTEAAPGAAPRRNQADLSLRWKEMLGRAESPRDSGSYGPLFVRHMLARGVQAAELHLAAKIRNGVLCVPARYSARQRQILHRCALAAGLSEAFLVSDSAALVAAHARQRSEGHLLVYQCGYLGFEVAVVSFLNERIHVLSRGGGESLSGRKLDRGLIDRLVTRAGLPGHIEETVYRTTAGVHETAAVLRRQLHEFDQVVVDFDFPGGEKRSAVITRDDWHQWVCHLVEETLQQTDSALSEARIRPADLTEVVLAGGPTMLPAFRQVLSRHLDKPVVRLHDWSAAFGAALLASRLTTATAVDARDLTLDVSADLPIDSAELDLFSHEPASGVGGRHSRGRLTIRLNRDTSPEPRPAEKESDTPSLAEKLALRSLQRAERLLEQNRFPEAVSMSHQAYNDDRQNPRVLAAMLDVHRRAAEAGNTPESYAKSIEWLLCANSRDPSNVAIRHALAERHLLHARQMLQRGQGAEAIKAAESALRFRPECPQTQRVLTEARSSSGEAGS